MLKQKVKNKLMSTFHSDPCTIVNITGHDVTVVTKGVYICRNKAYC